MYEGTRLFEDGVPFVWGNAYPDGEFDRLSLYMLIYKTTIGSISKVSCSPSISKRGVLE